MSDERALIERELAERKLEKQARSGRLECCVCHCGPGDRVPVPIWRINGEGAEFGPLWCCAEHFAFIKRRLPGEADEQAGAAD